MSIIPKYLKDDMMIASVVQWIRRIARATEYIILVAPVDFYM